MGAVAARHGPCRVTGNNSPDAENNPFSWNNEVNMLYIDQPIGTGFSYGTAPITRTTDEAAQDVWKFLQVFFQHRAFKKYQSRNLGIWSESYVWFPSQHVLATHFHNSMFPSYGGHYGPRFSTSVFPIFLKKSHHLSTHFSYILDQNAAIANGRISGVELKLKFLGIGNGITVRTLIFHPRNID